MNIIGMFMGVLAGTCTGIQGGVNSLLTKHWTGGLLGAYFVYSLVYLSPRVGASMVVALILAGQILAAVVLDHFGLFGYPVRSITAIRLVGIALLGVGVTLIRKS